ncbi:MAG: alpha-L-fucosidase, partial [Gemmatimonadota bacterium]|nr:alpha-L-fucosidase [Gemmatimonadota bacterium]
MSDLQGDTNWFTHDRFGLFIHWGLYALPARHEWVKQREEIPDA